MGPRSRPRQRIFWASNSSTPTSATFPASTDPYGKFIPGTQWLPANCHRDRIGANGITNTADDVVVAGNTRARIHTAFVSTGHAFLADIAHDAVPTGKIADGDIDIGLGNPDNDRPKMEYDNELLDAHFIAGDGRANENIGLTAVHHVFHCRA